MVMNQSVSKSTEPETVKLLWQSVVNGAVLKKMQGVSESTMESLYAHAYKFYQSGRLDDAEVFFRFLCLHDSHNPDYVMGLAATLQQKKQYRQAIDAYELTFFLEKNDYRPKLHIGQCYLFLKEKELAQKSFAMILESNAPAAIKAQAQAYLATIKPSEKFDITGHSEELHA